MKHAHTFTPRNSDPKTTQKQQLKATYYASNTKTKKPKLTIEISKQIIKQ